MFHRCTSVTVRPSRRSSISTAFTAALMTMAIVPPTVTIAIVGWTMITIAVAVLDVVKNVVYKSCLYQ